MVHSLGTGTRWALFVVCSLALALAQAGALAAPWFTTGRVTRSAYGFVRALVGSGAVHGWEAQLLRASVFALPLLAGLTFAAAVLRAGLATAVLCGTAGSVLLILSVCVLVNEHGSGPLGPWLASVVGCCAITFCLSYAKNSYPKKRSNINVG